MFTHILVPLDGSDMAEAALPAAVFLAEKLNASVTLFHVIEQKMPRVVHGQTHLTEAAEAETYLKKVGQGAFPPEVPMAYHVHSTEVDNVAESIVAHADELTHDLIVMCSHGRGKALHLFLGSIAQKVIAMGSIPVLMTYPSGTTDRPFFSCDHILLPLDDDPTHIGALPAAKQLATACGAALHLVTAIPDFGALAGQRAVTSRFLPGTTSKMLEISAQQAAEHLQWQVESLRKQGFTASASVLRGDPARVIGDSARRLRADLMVLATHGKSGMTAFWEGSVANKICSRCRIPLLLIPVEKN